MKIIAYYLPQFHPIPENNEWWGNGYTEWTNVGKALKLYRGHYQPKVPADLGYYDLRVPEVRKLQAKLAEEAGVSAFCYWHYWFGNGKQLLEMPINEVLKTKEPDFPFCFGWANESWKAKTWNNIPGVVDRILIKQEYPGEEDIISHFDYVFEFVKDRRYITHEGRPIFLIYKPLLLQNAKKFIHIWNKLLISKGYKNGFYFVGHTLNSKEIDSILELGFDAVNIVRTGEHRYNLKVTLLLFYKLLIFKFFRGPLRINYSFISKFFLGKEESREEVLPTIIPNWDHTPRSGRNGVVFDGSSPDIFSKHVNAVFDCIKNKNNKIIFLKSWNEWGEGNYMEPDLKYGKAYLKVLKNMIYRNGGDK